MLFPIAAIALLAYLLLRSGALPRLRGPGWFGAFGHKAASAAIVAAALAVLVHGNVWAAFCLFGLSLWMLGRAGSARPRSTLRSAHTASVRMDLDPATGRMSGQILNGPYGGTALDALDLAACRNVLDTCRGSDPDGARLLEAYLDRRFAGWRATGDADRDPGERRTRASGGMSEEQAYEVLGLGRGASREEIVGMHRTLMKKWHPDQGGTAELAARANEAKEVLLRRHG